MAASLVPILGRVTEIFPEHDYGFVLTAEGREVYFPREAVDVRSRGDLREVASVGADRGGGVVVRHDEEKVRTLLVFREERKRNDDEAENREGARHELSRFEVLG